MTPRPPSPLALLVGGLAVLAALYFLAVLPALLFLALGGSPQ